MEDEMTNNASPKQVEQVMRMGFYIALVIFLIILFMYVRSMGTKNETGSLLLLLMTMAMMAVIGFLWRRAYWRMRRAALEDGFD